MEVPFRGLVLLYRGRVALHQACSVAGCCFYLGCLPQPVVPVGPAVCAPVTPFHAPSDVFRVEMQRNL